MRTLSSILLSAAMAVMSGCLSLYTRAPWTNGEIMEIYQSTQIAASITAVAAFPQIIDGGAFSMRIENVFTVPFWGLPCAVDTCLEAMVDTLFLPADWVLSERRK